MLARVFPANPHIFSYRVDQHTGLMIKPATPRLPDPPSAPLWIKDVLPLALPASHWWPIFNTGAIFFLHFSSKHSFLSLTYKVTPGCKLGPKPNLAASRLECLTTPCCQKNNKPVKCEVKSNNLHYPERLSATFSLCVPRKVTYGILFHGSSFWFSGWI